MLGYWVHEKWKTEHQYLCDTAHVSEEIQETVTHPLMIDFDECSVESCLKKCPFFDTVLIKSCVIHFCDWVLKVPKGEIVKESNRKPIFFWFDIIFPDIKNDFLRNFGKQCGLVHLLHMIIYRPIWLIYLKLNLFLNSPGVHGNTIHKFFNFCVTGAIWLSRFQQRLVAFSDNKSHLIWFHSSNIAWKFEPVLVLSHIRTDNRKTCPGVVKFLLFLIALKLSWFRVTKVCLIT